MFKEESTLVQREMVDRRTFWELGVVSLKSHKLNNGLNVFTNVLTEWMWWWMQFRCLSIGPHFFFFTWGGVSSITWMFNPPAFTRSRLGYTFYQAYRSACSIFVHQEDLRGQNQPVFYCSASGHVLNEVFLTLFEHFRSCCKHECQIFFFLFSHVLTLFFKGTCVLPFDKQYMA